MNDLNSDMKAILHSKRANLYYLEKCRVMQKDGRILYLTEEKNENLYWSIPIANTTVLLLGTGTSITQAAMRIIASAGVLVGFCGGDGTPLFSGTEIEWITPQNEYRPTEYVQKWLSFWFDEAKRLEVAKAFQMARIDYLWQVWGKDRDFKGEQIFCDAMEVERASKNFRSKIDKSKNTQELLLAEAEFVKNLYQYIANQTQVAGFTRAAGKGQRQDSFGIIGKANSFLDHGNYLAYGLAATTLWVLGIPHGFAVMHGKTRRGALVFDVADFIKDAIVLPYAFICAKEGKSKQDFRQQCLLKFAEHKALDYMFHVVKNCCGCSEEEKENLNDSLVAGEDI